MIGNLVWRRSVASIGQGPNRKLWEGRAYHAGRMNRGRHNVVLVANVILRAMGLPLTPEGEQIEALAIPQIPLRKAG